MIDVKFGEDIFSYRDFNMILTEYRIGSPQPKRYVLDIVGMDGVLDNTKNLTDIVKFQNRQITLQFEMQGEKSEWEERFSQIRNALHGRNMKVSILTDRGWYWDAFVTVTSTENDRRKGIAVISLDAYPYQKKETETVVTVTATESGTAVFCTNNRMPVIPSFVTENDIEVDFGNYMVFFPGAGTHKNGNILLREGVNELVVKGSGTVEIRYQEGRL